jgi:hypothetical protein
MRWSAAKNKWEYQTFKCDKCSQEFTSLGAYRKHEYDENYKKKKNFPDGMQKASQFLILGLLAKAITD